MASARLRQQTLSTSSNGATPSFPAPPTTIPTKMDDQSHTPPASPPKRVAGISQAQKQALVDNLQLEITERARKLRAQYTLQAQGLRARLEMRVNRIPQALRKRNIQDLLDEHTQKARPLPPPPVPSKVKSLEQSAASMVEAPRRSLKRQSDQISVDEDKENVPAETSRDLPVAKKRAKTATATANAKATRTASRQAAPSTVLSPKSHNSRTLPRSPFKTAPSAEQSTYTGQAKPSSQLAVPKPSSRAPSRQGKRGGAASAEMESRSSEASTTSAGTTIITKAATKQAPAVKKPTVPAKATAGRKPAAVKKENVAPVSAGGGRTLRKRG